MEDRGIETRFPTVELVERESIEVWPPFTDRHASQERGPEDGRRNLTDASADVLANPLTVDDRRLDIAGFRRDVSDGVVERKLGARLDQGAIQCRSSDPDVGCPGLARAPECR